ncbi:MAG TPA: FISUMP domain-containing protein, partial [Candidatus Pacearchaeota archaeon]|nr:FISUMP domain-containing protein [Candidatus Pacearchaeota archaeon]
MRKKNKIILSLILTAFLSLFFLMNFVSASDTSSDVEYGLLYNWYTVDDSRGLCPEGWHVPSYTEFQTFHEYLEPVSYFYMDYKIKEVGTDHWVPNEGATDETGFSALGGGMRTYTGIFIELKERADFISSTSFSEVYPEQNRSYDCFEIYLSSYSSGDIWVGANRKKAGSSVRCIRDSSDEWAEGEVVVDYDGNVYNTVVIGTLIWT